MKALIDSKLAAVLATSPHKLVTLERDVSDIKRHLIMHI